MKTHRTLLAGAAMAGLITGNAARIHAAEIPGSDAQIALVGTLVADDGAGKHSCKGQNTCKGQGGCKSGDNGCKGQNSCKGKGGCATDGSKA